MKKNLLFIVALFSLMSLSAQVTFDYESPEASINFQFFGGDQEGILLEPVANPNPTGINTSATVFPFTELPNGPEWSGGFSNPDPIGGVDASAGGQVCLDVHFAEANSLTLKLETGDPADEWEQTISTDIVGEWTTICYDLGVAGEANGSVAVGKMFTRVVLFIGLGEAATAEQVVYLDNWQFPEAGGGSDPVTQVIFDFESPETTTNYTYFGSSLQDQPAANIANPNPTGVNTSATVVEYVKAANSELWAGAYANPAPTQPIDATTGGTLCVDVHYDHIGNIALKLEGGPEGTNWVQTVENTVINEWEQLCIDLSLPGLEESMNPATGNVYTQLVIFPDFQINYDVDVVSYVDNLVFTPNNTPPVDAVVSFSLDMNEFTGNFTTPHVSGSFNEWSGNANPLADDDGDGVWTTSIAIPNGAYEYKFTLDDWTVQEEFPRSSACTSTFDDGNGGIFTNRVLVVNGDLDIPTSCFNSCYACGEGVNITINLGVADPAESGIWLAGGAEFGAPGGNYQMLDDDNDGVFTISMERQIGFEGYYTFTNGNCPDFSCKENIAGQECARPENFNDRFLEPVMADVTVNTCFGECSIDTDCTPAAEPTMTTFSVDMNQVAEVNAEGVRIAGQFSNWGDVEMSDDDGDGVWTITLELDKGPYEYKFKNGPDGWENLEAGTECTVTTPDGEFTNRFIDLTDVENVSEADEVCFESCTTCLVNTNNLEIDNNLIKLYPTVANDIMYLDVLTSFDNGTVQIISLQGEVMNTILIGNNTHGNVIQVANYPQGTYMLSLTTDTFRSTQRFVKM